MKLYGKIVIFAGSLRTGLFVVCFLAAVLLSGCGSEDTLLSELREEDAADGGGDEAVLDESAEQDAGDLNAQDPEQNGSALNREVQLEPEKIYVHVCGAVKHPGVYGLPVGSRFYEAVEAAGGFGEDACQDYLNMAAPLTDGSRLEIPTADEIKNLKEAEKEENASGGERREAQYSYYTLPEESGSVTDSGSAAAESPSQGLVNINTADAAELCNLPGVGEGRAKAIIEYREKQGVFQKKEDIMQVSGIGEKMYARMEEYLTVE